MSEHHRGAEDCGKVVVEDGQNSSVAELNPSGKESHTVMADPPHTPTDSQQRGDSRDLMWFPEENPTSNSKPISTLPEIEHGAKL
jgi:hypothetical protein